MGGRHLTKSSRLALSFTSSKWLTVIGGWGWKLVESICI
jgi:hypothetical protein